MRIWKAFLSQKGWRPFLLLVSRKVVLVDSPSHQSHNRFIDAWKKSMADTQVDAWTCVFSDFRLSLSLSLSLYSIRCILIMGDHDFAKRFWGVCLSIYPEDSCVSVCVLFCITCCAGSIEVVRGERNNPPVATNRVTVAILNISSSNPPFTK